MPCVDRQEHQIPWCTSSGELHLVIQHQLHQQRDHRECPEQLHPAWFGNCTASDRKTLQRIVKTAEKIIGVSLPSITDTQDLSENVEGSQPNSFNVVLLKEVFGRQGKV
ncbi:hypothetical protein QTP86_032059, partial [Hemibagrus guttatus]